MRSHQTEVEPQDSEAKYLESLAGLVQGNLPKTSFHESPMLKSTKPTRKEPWVSTSLVEEGSPPALWELGKKSSVAEPLSLWTGVQTVSRSALKSPGSSPHVAEKCGFLQNTVSTYLCYKSKGRSYRRSP